MKRTFASLASVAFAGISVLALHAAAAEPRGDEEGIKNLLTQVENGFNKQDTPSARAKAMLVPTTSDFTLSTTDDSPARTAAQCEAIWTEQFSTFLKGAHATFALRRAHFLKPDVAYIEVDHTIANFAGDDGKLRTAHFRVVGTVVKQSGKWLVANALQVPTDADAQK